MTTDIATLGIAVESRDVPRATTELNQLTTAGTRAERQVKKIETASDRMNRQIAEARDRFRALRAAIGPVIGLLASLGVALGGRALIAAVDLYKEMTNQLKLVTRSTAELVQVQGEIFDIAQRSRAALDATNSLYSRMARSVRDLGVGQGILLGVTETVAQTLAISGTNADMATGALRQLGQALGTGALRGDELISVMEGVPRLARAIVEGMGLSLGQIKQAAEAGLITTEAIIAALVGQAGAIAEEFSRMQATIGQAFTVLGNSSLRSIGQLDAVTGASDAVATSILYLGNNFEIVEAGAAGAGVAMSFVALRIIPSLITAVNAMTVAMARTPQGLLAVAFSSAVAALVFYRDELVRVGDTTVRVMDVVVASYELARDTITGAVDAISSRIDEALGEGTVGTVVRFVDDFVIAFLALPKNVINIVYGTAKTITDTLVIAFEEIYESGKVFVEQLSAIFEKLGEAMQKGVELDFAGAAKAIAAARQMELGLGDTNITGRVSQQAVANFTTDWVGALIDSFSGAGDAILAEIERRAGNRQFERNLPGFIAARRAPAPSGAGTRDPKVDQKVTDRIEELRRERTELERLIGARSKGLDVYDAEKRAIEAEAEAIKLGLTSKEANYALVVALAQANRDLQKTLDVNTRIAELQREQDELQRLVSARRVSLESHDETEAAIEAENAARELGLDAKSAEYALIVALAAGNSRLKETIDEIAKAETDHAAAVEDINSQLASLFPTYDNLAAEAVAWRDEALKNLDATKAGYHEFAADVERVFAEMLEEARRKDLDNSKEWSHGVRRALEDYVDDAEDGAAQMEKVTTDALSGMEDAFARWASTGKINARDMVNSILADLARLAFRQAVLAPILKIAGGLFTGGIGAVQSQAAIDVATMPNIFHGGGIAGAGGMSRAVSAAAFANAQRYHSGGVPGVGPDEVPIIARRNEEIITRADPRHRFNGGGFGGFTMTNHIAIHFESRAGSNGGGPDNAGMAEELGELVEIAISSRMAEWVREQMRPGNMLNRDGSANYGF